jgi:type IV pilus assembly protein PilC
MKYRYTARDAAGRKIKGKVEAGSKMSAAGIIKEQKMMPLTIDEDKGGVNLSQWFSSVQKPGSGEMTTFTRQLATMINAGLPLTDALTLLKVQSSPSLSIVVGTILSDVQSGMSLSSAMEKHPQVFSKVYTSLVGAGEASGKMENILNRLAETSEKGREFKAKVVGAMIYPIIVIIGMIGVFAVMILVVVPQLTSLYKDFDAELPFLTRVLIGISDFALKFWLPTILGIGLVFWGLLSYKATKNGREKWDEMMYQMPVAGPLIQKVMLTELTRTLSLLVGAGVSIVDALNIVSGAVGNVVAEAEVKNIARKVEKGFPVSISFTECELFPPIIGQMTSVGEETGKMDEVLEKLSRYFESESEEKIKGLTTAIEPLILIVLAVGVGFLMYAVIMPMYTIMDKI